VSEEFAGRTVVITGSGSGIGAVAAERFAQRGARTIVADIDLSAAQRVASAITGAEAVPVDVRDAASIASLVDVVGSIDVFVNNAMVCSDTPFLDATPEEIRNDIDVSLVGAILCAQAVLPGMIERGGGVILNVSSVNGISYFGNEAYSAAKAGLISLTTSIANAYGRSGVRCNAIAPGTIATPYWEERAAADPAVFEKAARWYPLGRIGTPADVSEALVFLASDSASWISGVTLPVDGGLLTGNVLMARELQARDD
jgi:meso-butanediol dehydrogenase/(S,S)-butanediol dehydrogenase/diacetyl reductase